MSEQLETIKCVDWTINFPGAAGGGADGERAHLWRQAALRSFSSEVHLDSFGRVSRAAIHPSQESYRSITLQTGREFWPLLWFSIVNHIFDWRTLPGGSQCKRYWSMFSAIASVYSSRYRCICEVLVSIGRISHCDLMYLWGLWGEEWWYVCVGGCVKQCVFCLYLYIIYFKLGLSSRLKY